MEELISINNGLGNYKKDTETRTITLTKDHLNLKAKKRFEENENFKQHDIEYNDVKAYVRGILLPSIDRGYKVVFEHENNITLLYFNR